MQHARKISCVADNLWSSRSEPRRLNHPVRNNIPYIRQTSLIVHRVTFHPLKSATGSARQKLKTSPGATVHTSAVSSLCRFALDAPFKVCSRDAGGRTRRPMPDPASVRGRPSIAFTDRHRCAIMLILKNTDTVLALRASGSSMAVCTG